MSNVSLARHLVHLNMTPLFAGTAHTSSPEVSAVWSGRRSLAGRQRRRPRRAQRSTGPSDEQGRSSPSLKAAPKSPSCEGDIASPEVAERLVTAAEETGLPLRGVVHSARRDRRRSVAAFSRDSLDRVWAPKAAGRSTARSHRRRELDWWVGFSSTSSLLGSPGQAAYAARMRGSMPWSRGDEHRVCLPPRSIGASGPMSASLAP